MSGGAFDYGCFRISQFADELREKIRDNEKEDQDGYCNGYPKETIEILERIADHIELSGNLAKEVEWLYSGDIGSDTFMGVMADMFPNK